MKVQLEQDYYEGALIRNQSMIKDHLKGKSMEQKS